MRHYLCTNIGWDTTTDSDEVRKAAEPNLPSKVVIALGPAEQFDDDDIVEDILSDTLSDTYGFCHNGFQFEQIEVIV